MTDAERFTEIYRKHSVSLYRFAFYMSGSEALAEEVTQDTFVAYMRHPDAFNEKRGSLGAYLYGVARHLVYRHMEQTRRFRHVEEEEDAAEFASETDLLADLTRSEDLKALQDAIVHLPEKYREVIVLCHLQEASYEDAAVLLGCPLGTVRSRLHRGRELLTARLLARCTI